MGILWAHTGAIGCIVLRLSTVCLTASHCSCYEVGYNSLYAVCPKS